jgi:hypothetical protein
MQCLTFLLPKNTTKKIIVFLLVLIFVQEKKTTAQVSNPRIPAEWEEIQAVVMEPEFLTMAQTDIPWELAIDPYVKVAQACVNEDIDFYILERESHAYSIRAYGDDGIISFDTICNLISKKFLISPERLTSNPKHQTPNSKPQTPNSEPKTQSSILSPLVGDNRPAGILIYRGR